MCPGLGLVPRTPAPMLPLPACLSGSQHAEPRWLPVTLGSARQRGSSAGGGPGRRPAGEGWGQGNPKRPGSPSQLCARLPPARAVVAAGVRGTSQNLEGALPPTMDGQS